MGKALPFSEIDIFVEQNDSSAGCIADTNFLVAINDKDHTFHDDAVFLFERLSYHRIPIYVSVTARAEFIDFHRRVLITEALMDMLASSSKWKISSAAREVLKTQRGWLDNEMARGRDSFLTDYRIKECKQAFLPRTQSGQIGWIKLCREFLSGQLLHSWEAISETLSLNYIDMRSEDSKMLFRKELSWEEMFRLAEESAIGTGDAMILNVLDSSVFQFAITADYDLAFGTVLSTKDKTVFVPESLYRRQLKKLRI